jgi:transposase-like protein
MAKKNHTVEQIIGKLREAEVRLSQGETVGQVSRSLSITEQTYYRWRKAMSRSMLKSPWRALLVEAMRPWLAGQDP